MLHTHLEIHFKPRPCTNFRAYYYDHKNSNTLLGMEKKYLSDINNFSDLPTDIPFNLVYLEWESSDDTRGTSIKQLRPDTEKLLKYYFLGHHLNDRANITLAPIIEFASKYGILLESPHMNDISITTLSQHVFSFWIINAMIRPEFQPSDILPDLYKGMIQAIRDHYQQTQSRGNVVYYLVYTPNGFFVEGTTSDEIQNYLCFRIPFTHEFLHTFKDDLVEIKNYSEFYPKELMGELAGCALASIAQYLSGRKLEYRASWDGDRITFKMTTHSPTVYYLLYTKQPKIFDKRRYDKEYSQTPYARLTNYFRSRLRGGHITNSEYQFALKHGKELCKDEYGYMEARTLIEEKLQRR